MIDRPSDRAAIFVFGEPMVELSGTVGSQARLGFGGDALNVAIHLARLGGRPRLVTALGRDPYSAAARPAWEAEGLDCEWVLEHPARNIGLYAIHLDAAGERSFTYWRERSAARAFFDLPGAVGALDAMAQADLLVLTGISLSIVAPAHRARLAAAARAVRARGGRVAFDPNYRTQGWSSPAEARDAYDGLAGALDVVLTGVEDERALYGESDPDRSAARWHRMGAAEVVVKAGARGAVCFAGDDRFDLAAQPVTVVDTTGAGDAFDAAYLSARLDGRSMEEAAKAGAALAARMAGSPGALGCKA